MKHDIRLVGYHKDIKLDNAIALFYKSKRRGIFVFPEDIENVENTYKEFDYSELTKYIDSTVGIDSIVKLISVNAIYENYEYRKRKFLNNVSMYVDFFDIKIPFDITEYLDGVICSFTIVSIAHDLLIKKLNIISSHVSTNQNLSNIFYSLSIDTNSMIIDNERYDTVTISFFFERKSNKIKPIIEYMNIIENVIIEKTDHICSGLCPVTFEKLIDVTYCDDIIYYDIFCECHNKPIIFIDKEFEEVIRKLNIKGYKTKFCCASHDRNDDDMYIFFENEEEIIKNAIENNLFNIGKYFFIDKDYDRFIIRGIFKQYLIDIEKYGFKKARQMRINLLLHLIDTLPQK